MTINGINGASTQATQMGMNQAMDSYSKNIQNQIANAQKQLQELSSNEEMTLEEKMKKRQEIQQEISDLNIQLRQHQIEQRREQQQSKGSSMDDMLGGKQQVQKGSQNGQSTGLSQARMKAMISADSSMKQAKVQGSVATQMQSRANVLKAEIKQSGSTEAKEAELADLEQKAVNATASQMDALGDVNRTMKEAAEADRESGKTDSEAAKDTKKADEKQKNVAENDEQNTGVRNDETKEISTPEGGAEVSAAQTAEVSPDTASVSAQGNAVHVDVRL